MTCAVALSRGLKEELTLQAQAPAPPTSSKALSFLVRLGARSGFHAAASTTTAFFRHHFCVDLHVFICRCMICFVVLN